MLRKALFWSVATFVAFFSAAAVADLTVKDGGGVTRTIKNFVCETTKLCNATVLIKSDGTEIFTSSNPAQVTGANGTFPVTGTFWQATQPVSLASVPSHAVTNAGTFATQSAVTAASGSYSAGAYAAGALAAGAFASGSGVDGWDLTQGTKADAAWTSGSGSVISLLKKIATDNATTASNTGGAVPAGSAIIGKVGIDQTTPGTTNAVSATNFPTTVDTNSGSKSASTLRVVLATDQPALSNKLLVTPDLPTGAATAAKQPALGTAGAASADVITIQHPSVDPCETIVQTSTPISITTATTTRIVAPAASKKTYICYLFLTSAAADNVGIVEGTGGTCGSGTAGVVGGSTAANGPNFAANGGMAMSAGGKTAVAVTAGTNVDFCLITSAATPLAGVAKWVQAP